MNGGDTCVDCTVTPLESEIHSLLNHQDIATLMDPHMTQFISIRTLCKMQNHMSYINFSMFCSLIFIADDASACDEAAWCEGDRCDQRSRRTQPRLQHGRHHDHEGPHQFGRDDRGQPTDWR